MRTQNILVVCIGNICRSPMAEFFFKNNYPHLNVESAGISALVGHPADEKAIHCMQLKGIDIKKHIARQLNEKLIKNADLVLVMSLKQKRHIEDSWPFAKGKVFRLGHWQSQNVSDPYKHDQSFFDETCKKIEVLVSDWKSHL